MKKVLSILAATMATFSFGFAGGDLVEIVPVEEEVYVEAPVTSSFYVGGGYSYDDVTLEDGFGEQLTGNNNGIMLDAGYNFNEYIAVEGRYNQGFENMASYKFAEYNFVNVDVGDLKYAALSLFAKPQYSFGDAKVYGLLGASWSQIEFNSLNEKIMDWEPSFAYGVGGAYGITDSVEVFVDYTNLYNDTFTNAELYEIDGDIYTVNAGVNFKF